MGRSSACLRIVACGHNSDDGKRNETDLRISEVKSSKDKLRWSFRKKSLCPRVLSNTVITEKATYGHKEYPDVSAMLNSQFTGSSNDSGKSCLTQCGDDKVQLADSPNSIASELTSTTEHGEHLVAKSGKNVRESAAIVVQATIRQFLAQRMLAKLKDSFKPQPEVQCNVIQKSVTSFDITVELGSIADPQESEKSEKPDNFPGVSLSFAAEAIECKLENGNLVPYESEDNLITYEGEKIQFHPYRITDSVADDDAEQASSEVHLLSKNPKSKHFEQLRDARSKFTSESDMRNAKDEKIHRYAVSECGTELSISSTLDSPDRSEAGVTLDGLEKGIANKGTKNYDNAGKFVKIEDISTNLPTRLREKHVNLNHAAEDSDGSVVSIDVSRIEQMIQMNTSDAEKELSFQTKPTIKEVSSGSQELLQTSSGPLPTKSPKEKPKKRSSKNQKSISYDKNSPSKPNHGQPPKDPASGKKRDSFCSDQEHRNSTSSNFPRFMQATESARAKLQANSASPKSSPYVQEEDTCVKKRHSLSITNEKEISTGMQQSKKEKRWQR